MIDPCLWTQEDYTISQKCELRHQWMWVHILWSSHRRNGKPISNTVNKMISRSMLLRKRITASVL